MSCGAYPYYFGLKVGYSPQYLHGPLESQINLWRMFLDSGMTGEMHVKNMQTPHRPGTSYYEARVLTTNQPSQFQFFSSPIFNIWLLVGMYVHQFRKFTLYFTYLFSKHTALLVFRDWSEFANSLLIDLRTLKWKVIIEESTFLWT